ncbi:MAG TPA: hypothetical protein EYP14_00480, partial [Planctomycetaceae bacterium]|nr:hypothetical protein [Planctomycetaceae bacterium]
MAQSARSRRSVASACRRTDSPTRSLPQASVDLPPPTPEQSRHVVKQQAEGALRDRTLGRAGVQTLHVKDLGDLLEDLLNQTVMNTEIGVVQVLIGGEDTWEELSDCSMVLARYGA